MVAIGALAASVVLIVLGHRDVSTEQATLVALLGYLLTPFGVVVALACARRSGLARLDDPWFDRVRLRSQMRRLQILVIGAFLLAIPHVFVLARFLQVVLGLGV